MGDFTDAEVSTRPKPGRLLGRFDDRAHPVQYFDASRSVC